MLYRSEAGGCCDCGDVASWQPDGCCALHRPSAAPGGAAGGAALSPPLLETAQQTLALVFERLALAVEALATVTEWRAGSASAVRSEEDDRRLAAAEAAEEAVAHALVAWLQRVCAAAALRAPAAATLLDGVPAPVPGESPDKLRAALYRRLEPAGCAAQAELRAAVDASPLRAASDALPSLRRTPAALQRRCWPLVDRLLCVHALHALREPLLESVTTLLLLVRECFARLDVACAAGLSHTTVDMCRCCTTALSRSTSRMLYSGIIARWW